MRRFIRRGPRETPGPCRRGRRAGLRSRALCAALLPVLAGCLSSTGFEDRFKVSDEKTEAHKRAAPYEGISQPVEASPPASLEARSDGKQWARLTVRDAVDLALKNNNDFLTRKENLALTVLNSKLTRHNYGPVVKPLTFSATRTTTSTFSRTTGLSASTGLTQKLPLGGSVDLTVSESGTLQPGNDAYSRTYSASATVPLARGGGLLEGQEELVSSQRGVVYERRSFESNRQDFVIGIVETFFTLLQQRKNIRNFQRNLDNARQLLTESNLKFQFGRVTKTDVFRAQLQVTQAENALVDAQENLKVAEEAYKIDLGLNPSVEIDLQEEQIAFRPVEVNLDDYIGAALEQNPEWQTERDRYDDSKRTLAIARNASGIAVDLTGSYTRGATSIHPDDRFVHAFPDWSTGVSVEIPIDRASLNVTYQQAVTRFVQAQRGFMRARDEVVRQVRQRVTQLRQAAFAVGFQERAIREAENGLKLIQFEYRRGEVRNRDVVDAQDRLVQAQTAYEQALVDYRFRWLRLQKFAGKLTVDDGGEWLK